MTTAGGLEAGTAGEPAWPACVRETHSAVVILVGDRAYKVKKPVDLGFLDFRTLESRRRVCLRELELNRRLAPDVYLDVATLSGSDGQACEYVLVMRRMPDDRRLSTMIEQGRPVEEHLRRLARLMARLHARAHRGPQIAAEGTAAAVWRRWTANLRETETFRGRLIPEPVHQQIGDLARRYLDGREPLLAERAAAGLVVDGHGDLVADDVFCLPDGPRVLDCLEFDDRLRWLDVADDIAFLAMDLEHLDRPDLAALFRDGYAQFSGTSTAPSLHHHYVAYRAFVRAKVACIRADQTCQVDAAAADRYTRLALRHLQAGQVTLVLVGGPPGTGKTTLARALADQLGCLLLSSDTVRQQMPAATAADRYSDAAKSATYRELLARARHALQHGHSVIADATWGDADHRDAASQVAEATASHLISLHCQLPVEVAAARAQRRFARGEDASEAGAEVARTIAARADPWPDAVPVDTSGPPLRSVQAALATLTGSAEDGCDGPA